MDERQQQIKQGAGLEESRINVEFVEFLRRWSTPVLVVLAVLALAYAGFHRLQAARADRLDRAFLEYEASASTANPSPFALLQVAETYDGVRSIGELARLRAADIYLESVRKGLRPGAVVGPDGEPEEEDDILDDEDRRHYLSEAEGLYRVVFDRTREDRARALLALPAAFGLAAVAGTRDDVDEARSWYGRAASIAERAGFESLRVYAQRLSDGLEELPERPELLSEAVLPRIAGQDEPDPMGLDMLDPEVLEQLEALEAEMEAEDGPPLPDLDDLADDEDAEAPDEPEDE